MRHARPAGLRGRGRNGLRADRRRSRLAVRAHCTQHIERNDCNFAENLSTDRRERIVGEPARAVVGERALWSGGSGRVSRGRMRPNGSARVGVGGRRGDSSPAGARRSRPRLVDGLRDETWWDSARRAHGGCLGAGGRGRTRPRGETPRGGAGGLRSGGIRMGQPARGTPAHSRFGEEGNRGN